MRPLLLITLALILPAFAGCLGGDDVDPANNAAVADSAAGAGAVTGSAPAAAKQPYRADGSATTPTPITIHPVAFPTNAAKPQVTREFTGEFTASDCNTLGNIPLGSSVGANNFKVHGLADDIAPGDAFSYEIEMTFANADTSWGNIHLAYTFGGASGVFQDPTAQERGEFAMNFSGQSFRATEEDQVRVAAVCWYGAVTTPIPYKITLSVTFVEGALPASTPVLIRAGPDTTSLFVTALAINDAKGVSSHFRVFAPDDSLLCECALLSNQKMMTFELPGEGDYVVLVDHSDNGFVALGLDQPSESDLRPLQVAWQISTLASGDGGPIAEHLEIDIPTTPMQMWSWVAASEHGVGAGQQLSVTSSNARGEVLRVAMGGWVSASAQVPGHSASEWYPIPFGTWDFYVDHHAYTPGLHTVDVKADALTGDVQLFVLTYTR